MPPHRRTRQEATEPLRATTSVLPETATRTDVGTTEKRMRIVAPRVTSMGLPDAAIGAPQCVPQHQDEIARRTWPGSAVAVGGFTVASSRARSVITIVHRNGDKGRKKSCRFGELCCIVRRV